jgi:hypothetical protein
MNLIEGRVGAAGRKKVEEEAERARKSGEWEKNQSRIREYLESLSLQKRAGLEIIALTALPLRRGQISIRRRQSIIDAYVLDILDGRNTTNEQQDSMSRVLDLVERCIGEIWIHSLN